MQEFIALANILADEAGSIIRKYYRQPFEVETKNDDSPVTIADRTVEKRLREIIENKRPQDGILGEEFGTKTSQNGLTWVLDPIDGTKSFMIGRPTFGTLIALCEENIPVLGIIDQAILKERWIGEKDTQTTMNGQAVHTRPCKNLKDARIGSTTPAMFTNTGPAYEVFETGSKLVWGGDCYMYGLIAAGFMDMAFEASLSPYDYAALVPVITGAGGQITNWSGNPLTLESDGRVIALGDKDLWPDIRRKLEETQYI